MGIILPALLHPPIIRVKLGGRKRPFSIGYLIGDVTTNVVGSTFYETETPVFLGIHHRNGAAFLFAEMAEGSLPITRLTDDEQGHQGLAFLCEQLSNFFGAGSESEMCVTLMDVSHQRSDLSAHQIQFSTCDYDEPTVVMLAVPNADEDSPLYELVQWAIQGGAMLLGDVVTPKVWNLAMEDALLDPTQIPVI